ncbi:DUF2479 domain-containing protein, partial [Enterococcus pallens]
MKVVSCDPAQTEVSPERYNACTFKIIDKWDPKEHAKTCDTMFYLSDGTGAYVWDCDEWIFLDFSGYTIPDWSAKENQKGYIDNKPFILLGNGLAVSKDGTLSVDITPADIGAATKEELSTHENNKSNPHNVTASQVGAYTKAEADNKDTGTLTAAKSYTDTHASRNDNPHSVTASQTGAFTKDESSVNVLDTITGTKPTLYSEQLLVDSEQGTGSIFVKDLIGTENLMGSFTNSIWKIDSATGRIIGEGVTNSKTISEITLPAGEYTLSFTIYKKPSISSTFSCYLDDVSIPAYAFGNINNFELELLYTRKLVLSKETRVKYTLWGNMNHEPLDFEMKIEKGEYTGYTPAPEWYGIVHGQPNLFDNTTNEWESFEVSTWDSGIAGSYTLEQLGLKAGDTIAVRSEISNDVGTAPLLSKVFLRNSEYVTVKQISTNYIMPGMSGISSGEIVITDDIKYLTWSKCARQSNPADLTKAKVRGFKLIKGSLAAMDEWTPSQSDSDLTPHNPKTLSESKNLFSAENATLGYFQGWSYKSDLEANATRACSVKIPVTAGKVYSVYSPILTGKANFIVLACYDSQDNKTYMYRTDKWIVPDATHTSSASYRPIVVTIPAGTAYVRLAVDSNG